eukprot:TRINITY_DN30551_c0_g1_i2.p1 TRINITY_DN30551_c0_g1~~TRINITY_DN30551_c0_g1_i2.p1  ORF type:complete len:270 (-),score=34.12 TRINITY_DN30551_c0_g1_i2:610-1362(-)
MATTGARLYISRRSWQGRVFGCNLIALADRSFSNATRAPSSTASPSLLEIFGSLGLSSLLLLALLVKDEIEHLLDDSEDMAQLYLTRKMIQNFQYKALEAGASNSAITFPTNLHPLGSSIHSNMSFGTSIMYVGNDVEDLEMLLEAYFMQLEGTHNKILSVREYIYDTEDYVIIQLDHHRNELLRLQLIMIIASFAIGIEALICASFGMNIPCQLYEIEGIFGPIVGGTLLASFVIFLAMLARWRKLLGS